MPAAKPPGPRTVKAVHAAHDVRPARLFCENQGRASAFARLRIAVAAPRRRLDHDRFAGPDLCRIATLEPLHAAVAAPHPILADPAGLAADEAERAHAAMARQDGAVHFLQEADGAPHAVAGVPLAAAAGARAN